MIGTTFLNDFTMDIIGRSKQNKIERRFKKSNMYAGGHSKIGLMQNNLGTSN